MIEKVWIRNYKSLYDVTVKLEQFTVFVGANGSGKTSILEAIDLGLCFWKAEREDAALNDKLRSRRSFKSVNAQEIIFLSNDRTFRVGTDEHLNRYLLDLGTTVGGEPTGFQRVMLPQLTELPTPFLLRLELSKLLQMSTSKPIFKTDGTGLPQVTRNLALANREAWDQLQADLRKIIPTVSKVWHEETNINEHELRFTTTQGHVFTGEQMSEGTLYTLGILAAIFSTNGPSILLLDDLDRGLHPTAQKELTTLLHSLLKNRPDLQILATSHSSYLLDYMEPEEVRIVQQDDAGATHCAALASHPKFEKWNGELNPGEMWSVFGERWILEQPEKSKLPEMELVS